MRSNLGDRARLLHILDAISAIIEYTEGIDLDTFIANRIIKDAVEKQLAVIGEACDNLTSVLKEDNPDVEWFKIKGLRNRIIHQYFDIDIHVIWDIINHDLPVFKKQVTSILNDRFNEE